MIQRLLAVALLLSSVHASAGDWLLHRGDATQTGVSNEKLPDKLAIKWEFKTKNAIEGTVVVADGVVYAGSSDKHLYAIDLKTGQEKWKTKLGIVIASPGIKGERIYIGDVDGKFYCLNRATGAIIWTFENDAQAQITAAPNFFGETILIPAHDSTLYCLDKDGKKIWDFRIEGPIYGGVAVANGQTFLAGCDSMLHVLDCKTGKELGSLDLRGQSGASAAVLGDRLYVGTMSNEVLSINLKTLRIDWAFEAPRRKQPFYASAAVSNELVVIGSRDSKVWAIDRQTGQRKWDFLTDHKVDGSAVIVGERIFVGSFDERFYVLNLKGEKVADFKLDGAIMSAPAVSNGCVVVATDKGTVYCLGAKD